MSEIIRLGTENPSETQNFFKGVAEKYKDSNNQQKTLTGFSNEIREKLNIKGPNYVPGYDFSQAIIEQTLRKEQIDRRPGGLQKTSEDFLKFIEGMGINPQDPSIPLKKLAEEYLLRPYVTKVKAAKPDSFLPPSEPPPTPVAEIVPPPFVNAQATAEEQTASQLTEDLNKNNVYYVNRLGKVESAKFTAQQELSDKEKFIQLSRLKGWPSGSKPKVRLKADDTWEMMSFQSQQAPPTQPQETGQEVAPVEAEAPTEGQPRAAEPVVPAEEAEADEQPETPDQRTGRIRRMLGGLRRRNP